MNTILEFDNGEGIHEDCMSLPFTDEEAIDILNDYYKEKLKNEINIRL